MMLPVMFGDVVRVEEDSGVKFMAMAMASPTSPTDFKFPTSLTKSKSQPKLNFGPGFGFGFDKFSQLGSSGCTYNDAHNMPPLHNAMTIVAAQVFVGGFLW